MTTQKPVRHATLLTALDGLLSVAVLACPGVKNPERSGEERRKAQRE